MNTHSTTGRVLDVLEAFLPDHSALSLTEISVRTGLPVSTTHRILTRLAERGALDRGPDLRYTIGQPLAAIGALAPSADYCTTLACDASS
jgi:DNA-binding IclR family transcriptional regulator